MYITDVVWWGYTAFMAAIALIASFLVALGLVAFLVNVINTLGWANTLSLFVPERWIKRQPETASA